MKRTFLKIMFSFPLLCVLYSCNGGESSIKDGVVVEKGNKVVGMNSNIKMKTYSDDHIKFDYPHNWKIDVLPKDESIFYNLHAHDEKDQFMFTSVLHKEATRDNNWEKSNQNELETIFASSTDLVKVSEIIKTKNNKEVFYMEYQSNDIYGMAIFMPYMTPTAKVMMHSNSGVMGPASELIKSGIFKDLIKSMEIKF